MTMPALPWGAYPRMAAPQPVPDAVASPPAGQPPGGEASLCAYCACVHKLPSTLACPRLRSFELDGDGNVKAATFWGPGIKWAAGRAIPVADLHEKPEDGEEGASGVSS